MTSLSLPHTLAPLSPLDIMIHVIKVMRLNVVTQFPFPVAKVQMESSGTG